MKYTFNVDFQIADQCKNTKEHFYATLTECPPAMSSSTVSKDIDAKICECLLTYNCTGFVLFRWLVDWCLTPTVAISQLYRGGWFFFRISVNIQIFIMQKTFSKP
jgi:hypothetical protein